MADMKPWDRVLVRAKVDGIDDHPPSERLLIVSISGADYGIRVLPSQVIPLPDEATVRAWAENFVEKNYPNASNGQRLWCINVYRAAIKRLLGDG